MSKYLQILIGLLLLIIPILSWILYPTIIGQAALSFLIGGVVWVVLIIGFFLLLLGITDLKN